MVKKNILITGGHGRLARVLKPLLEKEGYRVDSPSKEEFNIHCDSSCARDVQKYGRILVNTYDLIIHTAAYTNVSKAESVDRKQCLITNVLGCENLSKLRESIWRNAKIIYISTDYAYPGIKGFYSETDFTKPFCFYGYSKLAGEEFFDKKTDLIIRTSFKERGYFKNLKICFNCIGSFGWTDEIAAKIVKLMQYEKAVGVVNVGSTRKTLFDLASEENDTLKIVDPIFYWDKLGYLYPVDISLNLNKYERIISACQPLKSLF